MIEIHASQVYRWMSCPASALHSESNRKKKVKKPMSVGMLLGNQVHADITGHKYDEPKRIVYDDITPSKTALPAQRKSMKEGIDNWMTSLGLIIEDKEISMEVEVKVRDAVAKICGTADMLVSWEGDPGEHSLADIKTGARSPATAWTQLAVYAWLWEVCGKTPSLGSLLVFWAKRNKRAEPRAIYDMRNMSDAIVRNGMISAMAAAKNAYTEYQIYNPSHSNCEWCEKEDCTMRFMQESPLYEEEKIW